MEPDLPGPIRGPVANSAQDSNVPGFQASPQPPGPQRGTVMNEMRLFALPSRRPLRLKGIREANGESGKDYEGPRKT